jgi:thioester reductase-like protein
VPGDLTRTRFGLPLAEWLSLAERIDTIYHSAARVNVVQSYHDLRGSNVLGSAEVLQFQATGAPKRLHAISSLSVFVASDRNQGVVRESDHLEATREVYGGYAQTKWAAEWLLRRAAGRAGPIVHYRPGLITGDTRTGRTAPHDFLTLFLRGLARLGCLPEGDLGGLFLDVTPIDYVAPAIVELSLRCGGADGETFHLANEHSLSLGRIVEEFERGVRPLERVPLERWQERLSRLQGNSPAPAAAVLALCRRHPGAETFNRYRTLDLFQATGVIFDTTATRSTLAGSGLDCPEPTAELVRLYLRSALPETEEQVP